MSNLAATITVKSVIDQIIGSVLQPAVPVLIGVAVVLFLYGLVKYLNSGFGDTKTVGEARGLMIWGIVALAVMVSIWGLVAVVQNTFLGGASPTAPPGIPFRTSPNNFIGQPTCDLDLPISANNCPDMIR